MSFYQFASTTRYVQKDVSLKYSKHYKGICHNGLSDVLYDFNICVYIVSIICYSNQSLFIGVPLCYINNIIIYSCSLYYIGDCMEPKDYLYIIFSCSPMDIQLIQLRLSHN